MSGSRGLADRYGVAGVATLCLSVALALTAMSMLVVTDDVKVLRLAVVTTLWAFLLAGLAALRRSSMPTEPGSLLEMRRAYQVELEREVIARREYELRLEVGLRRELEEALRKDVGALRRDLMALHRKVVEWADGDGRPWRGTLHTPSTRLPGGQPADPQARPLPGSEPAPDPSAPTQSPTHQPTHPPAVEGATGRHGFRPDGPEVSAGSERPGPPAGAQRSPSSADPEQHRPGGWEVSRDGEARHRDEPFRIAAPGPCSPPNAGLGQDMRNAGSEGTDGTCRSQIMPMHTRVHAGHESGSSAAGPKAREDIGEVDGTGPQLRGIGWSGSPWGATGWGTTSVDVFTWGPREAAGVGAGVGASLVVGIPTVSTSGEDAIRPGDRIDSDQPIGRVGSGESRASRKDEDMTEMESEVPTAPEEHAAPSVAGGTDSTPRHGVDPAEVAPEVRAGRHYRNDGDTGQFTRILGDAPRPTEGRRHRYREDDEENEVLTRILGH